MEDPGRHHGCHEKINMILKKVLKKLKMSQDVENKAYEMVEEMMLDRGIEPIDSDEYSGILEYWVNYQICWIKIIVIYSLLHFWVMYWWNFSENIFLIYTIKFRHAWPMSNLYIIFL